MNEHDVVGIILALCFLGLLYIGRKACKQEQAQKAKKRKAIYIIQLKDDAARERGVRFCESCTHYVASNSKCSLGASQHVDAVHGVLVWPELPYARQARAKRPMPRVRASRLSDYFDDSPEHCGPLGRHWEQR